MALKVTVSEVGWDGTVALAYTAEQLFGAAQLLTSDRIPAEHALRIACERHIGALLEYRQFLPHPVLKQLQAAQALCEAKIGKDISKEDAQQLAFRVMELLRDISLLLKDEPNAPLAA